MFACNANSGSDDSPASQEQARPSEAAGANHGSETPATPETGHQQSPPNTDEGADEGQNMSESTPRAPREASSVRVTSDMLPRAYGRASQIASPVTIVELSTDGVAVDGEAIAIPDMSDSALMMYPDLVDRLAEVEAPIVVKSSADATFGSLRRVLASASSVGVSEVILAGLDGDGELVGSTLPLAGPTDSGAAITLAMTELGFYLGEQAPELAQPEPGCAPSDGTTPAPAICASLTEGLRIADFRRLYNRLADPRYADGATELHLVIRDELSVELAMLL
ncbi:MAG: hypothetical protein KC561_08995, partial [Myxococcales bacterium]|nr:hypothetical protein [Myxococcales bacterium]